MSNTFRHKDKLEQNRGIIMQISIVASLLIILLLFENKTKSAEPVTNNYAAIDLLINYDSGNNIEPPLPNNEKKQTAIKIKNEKAQFTGGDKALRDYMFSNIQYSDEAKNQDIQGRVIVSFKVDERGKIKNAKVIRSIHPLLDTEALRLIKNMPDWQPERINGHAISSIHSIPVIFINKANKEIK